MPPANVQSLELNVFPVEFSKDRFLLGTLPYEDGDSYRQLRSRYWRTHTFRYDNQTELIHNIPIVGGVEPLCTTTEVMLNDNLLLLARGIQQAILVWIAHRGISILHSIKPLTFWGQTEQALLLSKALKKYGETPTDGLEVAIKYEIDCRLFAAPEGTYLGLVIDIATSNLIEIPVSELLASHFPIVDKFVCRRKHFEHDYLKPKLEILGRVQSVHASRLVLTDTVEAQEVEACEVFLEPRHEYLEATIRHIYPAKSTAIINELAVLRQELGSAQGKHDLIQKTANTINGEDLTIADGLQFSVESPLKAQHRFFPERISTDRPNMLFGPQGRSSGVVPDLGITTHGPFMYMLHERNTPLIAVICEKGERGRVEQFVEALRYGFDAKLWNNSKKENPFPNGLIGKYRPTTKKRVILGHPPIFALAN